tara:strand:+ start:562 stop:810 length:249 start_codon:yes stop_codon:yes gene_type:complete
MEMVKLVKGDRVIERRKVDYENNAKMWDIRGWKLDDGKPKVQPKPEPKPEPKPQPTPEVKPDALSSDWVEEEKPKKSKKKDK